MTDDADVIISASRPPDALRLMPMDADYDDVPM